MSPSRGHVTKRGPRHRAGATSPMAPAAPLGWQQRQERQPHPQLPRSTLRAILHEGCNLITHPIFHLSRANQVPRITVAFAGCHAGKGFSCAGVGLCREIRRVSIKTGSCPVRLYSRLHPQRLKTMLATRRRDPGSLPRAPPAAIRQRATKAARLQRAGEDGERGLINPGIALDGAIAGFN